MEQTEQQIDEQETNRKLATIQEVLKVEPIPNADSIEKLTILGWECVARKGEFKQGQLIVYFEVDSLLPRKEWNEFLFHNDKQEVRLKTVKLRKQISQGLVMPVSILKEYDEYCYGENDCSIGEDVTEVLGIKKYVPYIPANLMGLIKGTRPEFVPKTDEPRIQGEPQLLERYKGKTFYVTEKIDGSSMSIYFKDGEFGVCSRNMDLKETEGNAFWKIARELDIENKLRDFGKNLVLQGELWGQGIQKNTLKSEKINFNIFDVIDIDKHRRFDYINFLSVVTVLGLETVPIIDPNFTLNHTVKTLVDLSEGGSSINNQVYREGIVLRPLKEERDTDIGRLSFKVINPKYLLKHGE